MSKQDDFPSKWEWWKVSDGKWRNLSESRDMEWLEGELLEMAKEYGVHSEKPVLIHEGAFVSVVVFGLKNHIISDEIRLQVADYHEISRMTLEAFRDNRKSEYEALSAQKESIYDSWADDSQAQWLYFFEPVYPSTHLVYVHYSLNVEAYGVFCETYKDMLDVVALVLR